MQKDTTGARVTVALPARGQPCAAEPNMQTAKLGIQPHKESYIYNKMTILEDLPGNQAQERAQKYLHILKRDSEKYREIILQGCLLAKIKGIELQRR